MKMPSFKTIKKTLKDPKIIKEIRENENAMKHARKTMWVNYFMSCVMESLINDLKKYKHKEVTYTYKDSKTGEEATSTTSFDEIEQDIVDLTKEAHIEDI